MTDFIYPDNYRLQVIERDKIVRLTQNRPVFEILPIVNNDSAMLVYEQLDNIRGLQQARGLNGKPLSVKRLGVGVKEAAPGYYGEFLTIDELELTKRRALGTPNVPINITDLVTAGQDQLLQRRIDRQEVEGWTLLATGTYTALGSVGQVLHTDAYGIQTYPAGIPWATQATAAPLADLRAAKLLARGHSVSFGRKAQLFMNQGTFNSMLSNTNANDLGSKRQAGLASITGVDDINRILLGEDLPQIVIYDEGYYDDAGAFQLFIPNNRALLVGVRQTGVPIGQWQLCRNANNVDMAPGAYMRVIDNLDREIPREIQVHDGMNGGPVLFYPNSVVAMTV